MYPVGGGLFAMSPADCRARGSAHRGGQPSGNAVRVADAVGV
jgi:hypothetical protein